VAARPWVGLVPDAGAAWRVGRIAGPRVVRVGD